MRFIIPLLVLALYYASNDVLAQKKAVYTKVTTVKPKVTTKKPAPTKDPKKCTGANEVYTLCDNNSCLRDCSTFWRTDLECKPICTPGCICKPDYLRNTKGECVKPSKCDTNVCPQDNQEINDCASQCLEDCQYLGQNRTCNSLPCKMACVCKPGFYKNANGECVEPSSCVCGENQEVDVCYDPCPPETCAAIGGVFECPAPPPCRPACKCKLNYKRDADGACVDIRECPQPFICETTAHYDACPDCVDERCLQPDTLMCIPEPWLRTCVPSCRCNDGLCRDPDLNCVDKVPYESCNNDPNAYSNKCGDPCPVTCNNVNNPPDCEEICKEEACKCKPGFVRHYDILGKCIPVGECPKCGPNEFFNCGSPCDTVCGKIGDPCDIVSDNCVEQCYCNEGYARDIDNVCVPVESCPVTEPCNGDENADPNDNCNCKCGFIKLSKEKDAKCVAQTCSDVNAEYVSCPNPCSGGTCVTPAFSPCKIMCKPCGCQCKNGFVKKSSKDATCIALKSCPKIKK